MMCAQYDLGNCPCPPRPSPAQPREGLQLSEAESLLSLGALCPVTRSLSQGGPGGGRRECGSLCASLQSGCLSAWWSWESSSPSSWWGSAGASAVLTAAAATSAAHAAPTPAAALGPVSKKRRLPPDSSVP